MNSKKSKYLRKKVYGEKSQRGGREYVETNRRRFVDLNGNTISETSTIVNKPGSPRAVYQAAKKVAVS